MPDEETLAGFYQTAAYYRDRGMDAVEVRRDDRLRAWALRARLGPGRLLDVGCGTGAFLAAAREAGFEVVGTELSRVAAETARGRFGIDVRVGPFVGKQFGGGERFDVITMIHVLEHMRDPAATLATARRLLVPGGVVVIEVPNRRAVAARLPGPGRRAIYDLPLHLHHFTPPSLRRLVEGSGLAVESVVAALPDVAVRLLGVGAWLAGLSGARGARERRAQRERGEAARDDAGMHGGTRRRSGQAEGERGGGARDDRHRLSGPGPGARATAWIRENLPGWKLTAVARRPEEAH